MGLSRIFQHSLPVRLVMGLSAEKNGSGRNKRVVVRVELEMHVHRLDVVLRNVLRDGIVQIVVTRCRTIECEWRFLLKESSAIVHERGDQPSIYRWNGTISFW